MKERCFGGAKFWALIVGNYTIIWLQILWIHNFLWRKIVLCFSILFLSKLGAMKSIEQTEHRIKCFTIVGV
jgi:hypothetical protein